MTDLEQAIALLRQQDHTCVLCRDLAVYTSRDRGVKPLLTFLDSGISFAGFSAADKVVGKATAFLYVLLGVTHLYAPVVSASAVQVLAQHGVLLRYDTQVEAIFNHRRDGLCPMESATRNISDPAEALAAIRRTLQNL